jgi:endonuclease/exonuclease/phosphatase family metal-dependent hydrolase
MDKKLIIYSWNVLNPNIHINMMSWKKKYRNKMAVLDNVRFTLFRKNAILNIIQIWLNSKYNVVICLQECCQELIDELILLDVQLFQTVQDKNDDYRVTIVKNAEIVSWEEIELNLNGKQKNALKIVLSSGIDIINTHLHWRWNISDTKKAAKLMIKKLCSEKFVICGDMNKTQTTIQGFLDEFDCIMINNELLGYTGINTQTGKKDIIDHILLSNNIVNPSKIKIINTVNQYKLMYNFKKIKMHYESTEEWLEERHNRDISDHKPIKIKIEI